METMTVPAVDTAAYQKATLIQDALQTLRAADQIDERDDLNAERFLSGDDRTIPDVRDIKILAGAMEIELARRRGGRIEDERDVTQRVTTLSGAVRVQRSRDRVLAEQPEAVDAFVQREVKAKRVPTVRGAVKAAHAARATAAPHRRINLIKAIQARHAESTEHIGAAITKIADGKRRTDAQVATFIGYNTSFFLQKIRLIPWLRIDRTSDGIVFQIDEPLRAICEGHLPAPNCPISPSTSFSARCGRRSHADERRITTSF